MIEFAITMGAVLLTMRYVWSKEAEINRLKDKLALEKMRFDDLFSRYISACTDLANLRYIAPKSTDLTDGEIKRLIHLCHPDKHNNSQVSVEMTKKLLAMKGR